MKSMWKAAVAAVAMVAGAGQAQAVRWLAYTVTGSGIVTTGDQNRPGSTQTYLADFTAVLTVNVDQGSGFDGATGYSTTGDTYTAQTVSSGVLQTDTAIFSPDGIVGFSTLRAPRNARDFSLDSRGGMNFSLGSGTVFAFANGAASGLVIAEVSGARQFGFDYQITGPAPAPEPAAWAMMLVGFGAIGAIVRRRVSYATA